MADDKQSPWPPRELLDHFDGLTDLQDLRSSLEDLRAGLSTHFDSEEASGGMLDRIVAKAPQHDADVDRIKAEHLQMLARLDSLGTQMDEVMNGPLAEIHQGLQALKAQLMQHEADEAELLNETMLADLGGHN